MTEKFIRIKFPNGEIYDIPAAVVAKPRARYYANHDVGEGLDENDPEWLKVFKDEVDYTMSDDGELYDWIANNMNWGDVKEYATRIHVDEEDFDYDGEFINVEKEIIEK